MNERDFMLRSSLLLFLTSHRALLGLLACYFTTALIVPVAMPVAIGDDWLYARSVEILLEENRFENVDPLPKTLLFQVLWGALFAKIFGAALGFFGSLRFSIFVLVGLSGIALYFLCRELGVNRERSTLGTAAYLFNPLIYVLSFTFMTDATFTALLVITTLLYVRAINNQGSKWMWGASAMAAIAILERQHGILIPLGVVTYLLLAHRVRLDRNGVMQMTRVCALPLAAAAMHSIFLKLQPRPPHLQNAHLESVTAESTMTFLRNEAAGFFGTLTFMEAMYCGFFALPLALVAFPAIRSAAAIMPRRGWVLFSVWSVLILVGLVVIGHDGRRMPYVPHYVNPYGLGPYDLRGGRPWIVGLSALDWATGICAVSALLLGFFVCRWKISRTSTATASGESQGQFRTHVAPACVVLCIAFWQLIGIIPVSIIFRGWTFRGLNAPSLDRYLLPLLPFVIILLLWSLHELRIWEHVSWAIVAVLAILNVVGTRDSLVFQQSVWQMARHANALGVPNTRLDAGAAWDMMHLYEYSRDRRIVPQTPNPPWWIEFFAQATDSHYVVAGAPLPGYSMITRKEYSAWLNPRPVYLYLLRRDDGHQAGRAAVKP